MLGFLYFNLTFCLFLTPPPIEEYSPPLVFILIFIGIKIRRRILKDGRGRTFVLFIIIIIIKIITRQKQRIKLGVN